MKSDDAFQVKQQQFPVRVMRVCFAMTINKAQGQTLHKVGCAYPHPCSPTGSSTWRCAVWATRRVACADSGAGLPTRLSATYSRPCTNTGMSRYS